MSEQEHIKKPVFSTIVKDYERDLADPEGNPFSATVNVLDTIVREFEKVGLLAGNVAPALVEHWYTRLASAITSWATDPKTVLNLDQLAAICRRKQVFVYIFSASGFRNMGHLTWLLADKQAGPEVNIAGPKVVLLLALLGLDDLTEQLVELALGQPPAVRLHLMLGWLNQRTVLTSGGEANRSQLLAASDRLRDTKISDADIGSVVNAYMYCSYASAPFKHDIKAAYNELLKTRLDEVGIAAPARPPQSRDRPRLLIIHERFRTGHAMHRCYAPMIAELRENFELVALVEDQQIDAAAEQYFDSTVKISTTAEKNVQKLAAQIDKLDPDIIFYPSLGMCNWTVPLSNLRLAPIQIMAQGHPATSKSRFIDYAFIIPMEGDAEELHSERILLGSSPVKFELHEDFPEELPEIVLPSNREIRIAVNAKVMKLSHRLMEICKRLEAESTIPVRFRFFPGEFGWFQDGVSAAIKSQLPTASVAPYQTYSDFLLDIAGCDFGLAAFPFGNTNSSVDNCLLGVPTVVHFGVEAPAQTDAMVLRTAGYPEWLICHNDEQYFKAAMRLINNPEERAEISRNARKTDLRAALSDNEGGALSKDLNELIWYAYQNHEVIVSTDVRVVRHADIVRN